MRAFRATLGVLAVSLLLASPAHAWWGWLDDLSGPGPFWGAEFDFRIVCLMEDPPWAEAFAEAQVAAALLQPAGEQTNLTADQRQAITTLRNDMNSVQPRPTIVTPAGALDLAKRIQQQLDSLRTSLPAETQSAVERALSSLRATAVPRVSKLPGSVAWASCTDKSKSDDDAAIRHRDRHEVLSLVLNYREYWNSRYAISHWGQSANDNFANGEIIHLRVIEPKVSFPLSGRFDVLDGQSGIGLYNFSSKGMPGSQTGLIVEPIRFDLHFPSRLADEHRSFPARLALALSVRSGLVLFKGGFKPDAFAATGAAARQISGEAVFEYGIVVNVGRLIK